ncbi:MAG: cyclophilin-like family protein [Hyphomicrobiaceae bacterium]
MPTNILRKVPKQSVKPRSPVSAADRIAILTAGRAPPIRLQLSATETAAIVWRSLPLFSTAETWGECVHFEVPVECRRDRTAKLNGETSEVYFWTEDDRIIVPFGPTAISRAGEIRLPRPCNLWAVALDDVRALIDVTPGEKVSLAAAIQRRGES